MENFRKALWILFYYPIYGYNYWKTRNIRRRLNLLKSEDTVQYILQNRCSVSRYGDGELQMMSHYMQKGDSSNFHVDTFQNFNQDLAKRLVDVYQKGQVKHLVCLPYSFKKTTGYGIYEELFWKREWLGRYKMLSDLSLDRMFGDTNFTRFYMGRSDIHNYDEYIKTLKQIWDGRKLLIVEGTQSRLGVGNDLFSNSRSIERILCPSTNAYSRYDEILEAVKSASDSKLVLIALGLPQPFWLTTCRY